MEIDTNDTELISEKLKKGEIGVLPTDTVYGIHCLYGDQTLLKRIYEIKERPEGVLFIGIIPLDFDLTDLYIDIGEFEKTQIKKFWPGPNTLIFTKTDDETIALRCPDNEFLQSILSQTGPLVSTSANPHGEPIAKNITVPKSTLEKRWIFMSTGES